MTIFNSDVIEINHYLISHKNSFNSEVASKMREYRLKQNNTIEKIAVRSFMTPSYLCQLESGKYGLTLSKFVTWCNALEVNSNDILNEFLCNNFNMENIISNELQKDKNISKNIIEILKVK